MDLDSLQELIIPTVISQLLNGVKKLRLGNTSPTRDLTYVTDTCEGFLNIYLSKNYLVK